MANPVLRMLFAGCVCFAMIQLMSALTVDIPEPVYEVARGQSVTIRCIFKPQKPVNKNIVISWLTNADDPNEPEIDILTYYYTLPDSGVPDETVDVGDLYVNRVTQQQDINNGVANLTIKSLTPNDNRMYECKVQIPGDKAVKPTDTTKLVVLVAPSKPICTIKGTPEFFHNITLNCQSAEGTPVPTYKWERYDFTDKLQPNPFRSTDLNGVLSLFNISAETDGYYICTSKNKIASASCNMTLTVRQSSMNIASTAGIIGACVAALLLLVVIIYCCRRRRNKKDQSEEYDMGDADEYTDKEPHQIEERRGREVENKPDGSDKYKEDSEHQDDRRDNYDSRQGPPANPRFDYDRHDDRHSDRYDDRRDDRRDDRYDDRQSDRYDDRRDDRRDDRYDDRQSDRYDDRRDDRYDDRQSDRQSDRYDDRRRDRYDDRRRDYYDDPRDRVDDRRREYYDDPRDRADDRRRDRIDDRFDDRRDRHDYPDNRDRPPNLPANKPTRA